MSDYLFDKEGDDPEVARLEQLLGGYAHTEELRAPLLRRRRWVATAATITALAAAATIVFFVVSPEETSTPTVATSEVPASAIEPEPIAPVPCGADGPGFAFATEGGQANCGGGASGSGVLPIGEWLETSNEVSAQVEVADIGNVTVHGGSRVRLVGTGSDEHRLELARGRISAIVSAPPRLFVIDTPGASAVDLGCAYELAVDDQGRTHLQVTLGAVSLEGNGLVTYVAAGSEVVAIPGRGPGTPLAIDADEPLRQAVARFDAGDVTALDELLALADVRDAITLWNLLGRTEGEARGNVYTRLDKLHRRPSSVRKRDILQGQPAALEAWRESIEGSWME